jgi:hypothetical protein
MLIIPKYALENHFDHTAQGRKNLQIRGNRRNDIFRDKEDFEYYLNTIEEALF